MMLAHFFEGRASTFMFLHLQNDLASKQSPGNSCKTRRGELARQSPMVCF